MKKIFGLSVLIVALFIANNVNAQAGDSDSSKNPVHTADEFVSVAGAVLFNDIRYIEAQGTPYSNYQWENGTVVTAAGQMYKDVPVRIDLLAHKAHFKSADGKEFVIGTPLKEIKFANAGKAQHYLHGEFLPNKKHGWYQILVNQPAMLVKSFKKSIEEGISYGSTQLIIKGTENYFVYYNNTEFPIKKASDFANILPAKKAEIEAEVKNTKSLSKEEQLIAMVNFINKF